MTDSTSPPGVPKGKPAGRRTLEQCEAVVQESLKSSAKNFAEAGRCMWEIKTLELYKQNRVYGEGCTWDRYCKKRWRISKSYADKFIASAEVIHNLTNGDNSSPFLLLPKSESVVRPLTDLEPVQQREAWREAVELADGEDPTTKNVQAAVDKLFKSPPKPKEPEPDGKSDSYVRDLNTDPVLHGEGEEDSPPSRRGEDSKDKELQPEIPRANLKNLVGKLWTPALFHVPPKQEIEVAQLFLEMLHKKFPELKCKIK
jgi:hypothetical protein